ncbi:MAG: PBSX family phage terminase large subunit [Clostridia bacterium]|nr:PBSX family phage terminase large subunit [Clostridia bacterium]
MNQFQTYLKKVAEGACDQEELFDRYKIPKKDRNNTMYLAIKTFEKAAEKGSPDVIREVNDLLDAPKEQEHFSLPAHLLASSFVDLYRDIAAGEHSEYLLYGGRGSCKSSFISLVTLELLLNHPNIHILACRRIKDTLRDSVYAQYKWAIGALGLDKAFSCKTSPMEIQYKKTGQKIYFRGADDPGKLKSIRPEFGTIGILWFEELDQFTSPEEIRSIEQSVLRGEGTFTVFKSFNPPRSSKDWVNLYAKTPKEGLCVHKSTYLTVPPQWLGQKFLDDAQHLKETRPESYAHEYLGEANGTGGAVFDNVTLRDITEEEVRAFDRVYRGIDWGWYPDPFRYAAVHYQANEGRLYLFDEISGNKLTNDTIARLLKEHGVGGTDKITADSGGEGPKSINRFRELGFLMKRARKGPGSVEFSMKWLSSLSEIVIDPKRCPEAAKEFMEYEYEQDRQGRAISGYPDRDNHSIDAVRYALESVMRRR